MFLMQKVIFRIHYMRIFGDFSCSPIVNFFIKIDFEHYCKTIIQFAI